MFKNPRYHTEIYTAKEEKWVRMLPHLMGTAERREQKELKARATFLLLPFGFYDDGFVACLKRLYYLIFVRWFFKKGEGW